MTSKTQASHQVSLKDYLDTNDEFLNVNQTKDETTFETVDYFGTTGATLRCKFGVEYSDNSDKVQISLQAYHVKQNRSHETFVTSIGTKNDNKVFGPTPIKSVEELTRFVSEVVDFVHLHHNLTVGIYKPKESQDDIVYERFWGENRPFVASSCPGLGEFNYVILDGKNDGWLPLVKVMSGEYCKTIYGLNYNEETHRVDTSIGYSIRKPHPLWVFEREYENIILEARMKGEELPYTVTLSSKDISDKGIRVDVTIKATDGSIEKGTVFEFPNGPTDGMERHLRSLVSIFEHALPRSRFVKYGVHAIDEALLAMKDKGVTTDAHLYLSSLERTGDSESICQDFSRADKRYRIELKRNKLTNSVTISLHSLSLNDVELKQIAFETVSYEEYLVLGLKTYNLLSDHIK